MEVKDVMKTNSKMKDQELIHKVIKLVSDERRIGVQVLELLQEIEKRKAYPPLGYAGLFSFCVKELRYSEAQAYRRIQAMHAMSELPEIKTKIESGALTVTTVSQIQTHLRQKKREGNITSNQKKLELFTSIEHHSSKQVEKKIEELSGKAHLTVLTLALDDEMQTCWNEIKNRSAHSTRGDASAILKLLMKEWLHKNAPKATQQSSDQNVTSKCASVGPTSVKKDMMRQKSRYIQVAIKRQIQERDQYECQNCRSKFALQIDHRIPYSKGGSNESNNLRLLCRSCNLRHGIQEFGTRQMKRD